MKALIFTSALFLSLNAFAQNSCNESAKYDCRVLVEENTISLLLKDRETSVISVLISEDCSSDDNTSRALCKTNTIAWLQGRLNDFKANGFCY